MNGSTMSATIATSSGIGTATFSLVPAGTYTVSEAANADFVLLASACVPGTAGAPNSPSVIVGPGSMAACRFANEAKGKGVVTKNRTEGGRVGKERRSRGGPVNLTKN